MLIMKKIIVSERSYRKFYDTELDNLMAYVLYII